MIIEAERRRRAHARRQADHREGDRRRLRRSRGRELPAARGEARSRSGRCRFITSCATARRRARSLTTVAEANRRVQGGAARPLRQARAARGRAATDARSDPAPPAAGSARFPSREVSSGAVGCRLTTTSNHIRVRRHQGSGFVENSCILRKLRAPMAPGGSAMAPLTWDRHTPAPGSLHDPAGHRADADVRAERARPGDGFGEGEGERTVITAATPYDLRPKFTGRAAAIAAAPGADRQGVGSRRRSRSPSSIGEPGMGKSRMLGELDRARAGAAPEHPRAARASPTRTRTRTARSRAR